MFFLEIGTVFWCKELIVVMWTGSELTLNGLRFFREVSCSIGRMPGALDRLVLIKNANVLPAPDLDVTPIPPPCISLTAHLLAG